MLKRISPEILLRAKLRREGLRYEETSAAGCRVGYFTHEKPGRPTVVLLHGISAAAVHFDKTMPYLVRQGYNVLAPDLPAHGFSDEHPARLTADALFEAFVEILNQLAPSRFHLVGNSLGGGLVLRYALAHPERLSSLVALSPAGGFASPGEWESFKAGISVKSREEARAFLNRIYARPPWYLPLVYRFAIRNMNRKGIQELLTTSGFDVFADANRLSELRVPTLFVWGKCEKLFAPSQLEWFKRHLPRHVEVLEPQGVGHCPQLDSARWLNGKLHEFFSRHAPAPKSAALTSRPAEPRDLEALNALVNSAYRGDSSRAGWTTEADLLDGQRTDVASLRETISKEGSVILVFHDAAGELVGCVNLKRKSPETAYLGMLTIRPALQGSGLGREVLAEAERWAKASWGVQTIEMTVIRQRRELISWYERRGYRNTGRTEPFPAGDPRFGLPKVKDLEFVVLERSL